MRNLDSKQDKSLDISPVDRKILEQESIQERREKYSIIILVLLGFISSVTIGTGLYKLINNSLVATKEKGIPLVPGEEEESEEDIQFEPVNKIAYIYTENVWIYDLETDENKKITADGGRTYSYLTLAWRNKEELTFPKCGSGKCTVQTFSLKEEKIIDSFEVQTSQIPALRWSHKGDVLAYVFKKEGGLVLTIRSGGEPKNLGRFVWDEGRDFDYNDALYIRFSPNDEKVMIVNTFVFEGDTSLVVLNLLGDNVVSLERTKDSHPTFGFFMSNETIYYKKDKYLYVRSIESGDESCVNDRVVGAFNFTPSPDRTQIAYWTHDWLSGIATIWFYEIGTGDIKRFRDQEAFPVWTSNETLIALNAANCRKCNLERFEFLRFDKVDLLTKNTVPLIELDEIKAFTVDNF